MIQGRRETVACAVVVLFYAGLSLLYSRATPPLEASDEAGHFAFVLHLQEHGRLPVADPEVRDVRMTQEFTQPPLYYLPAALLVSGVDTSNWREFFVRQPGSPIGRSDLPGPKNMWRTEGDRAFPYQRTMLAIRLVRAYSMLLGIATIIVTINLARHLAPADSWAPVLAAVLVAFNPMFLFISNSVNNDNMVALLVPATLWAVVAHGERLLRDAPAVWTGVLTGSALLAKLSGAIVLPATAGFLLCLPGTVRQKARALVLWSSSAAMVSGWWLVRNQRVYGEWTAFDAHTAISRNLRSQPDPFALVREWDGFIKSYWGVFGAFNVIFPDWVYLTFYAITALGFAASCAFLLTRRRRAAAGVWLLAAVSVLNVLALALWTARLTGSQGRLLFPSLSAMSVLASVSLSAWMPALRGVVSLALAAWLLAMAFYGAVIVIPAQYP